MWKITESIVGCTLLITLIEGQSYNNDNRHLSKYRSSQDAAILSDARYLSGDGTFGAAYSQEDGVEFKEESDANGDRKGSYSYVDPNGHRRTVYYTAGKNGFQASGDHIPTARPVVAPKPEYEPLPQFNPPEDYYTESEPQYRRAESEPQYRRGESVAQYRRGESVAQYRRSESDPQYRGRPYESVGVDRPKSHYVQESIYRPLVSEELDSSRYYSGDSRQYYRPSEVASIATTSRPEYRYSEYRPIPTTKPPQRYIDESSRQSIPRQYKSPEIYRGQQIRRNERQFKSYQLSNDADDSTGSEDYNEITTRIPLDIPTRRFYPPGKLDFTRTPDGFSYTFTKN